MPLALTRSTPASATPDRPVPHQGLGPARLTGRMVLVKNPPNPNYISIWLWGVLRDPVLGGLGRDLRVSVDHTIPHTAV
jgi:hypothetical protein